MSTIHAVRTVTTGSLSSVVATQLTQRAQALLGVVYREAIKFGAVGAIAFIIDVGLFNLLISDLWPGPGHPPLDGHQKLAKIISASVATLWSWLGNRYWTFRHRRRAAPGRELTLFVVMNLVAMVISVVCLHISHNLLGFTSVLADNISGNVIGIGLGTLFRFWTYKRFVFNDPAEVSAVGAETEVTAVQVEPSTPADA